MEKICRFLVLLVVTSLLVGCTSGEYRYVEKGDNSYIVLGSSYTAKADSAEEAVMHEAPKIYFSSVSEMINDIKHGSFTDAEFEAMSRFPKNSRGDIQISSIAELYDATYPSDFCLEKVSWSGGGPYFWLKNGDITAELSMRSRDYISEKIEVYKSVFGTGIQKTEPVPEVNGTAYYFADLLGAPRKCIQYTFTQNDTEFFVEERYVEVYPGGECSKLQMVVLFALNDSRCFKVTIYSDNAFSRLSADELSQFGLIDYVETDVS